MNLVAWGALLAGGMLAVGIAVWIEPRAPGDGASRSAIAVEAGLAWLGVMALVGVGSLGYTEQLAGPISFVAVCVLAAAALCALRAAKYRRSVLLGPVLFALPMSGFAVFGLYDLLVHKSATPFLTMSGISAALFAMAYLGHCYGVRHAHIESRAP